MTVYVDGPSFGDERQRANPLAASSDFTPFSWVAMGAGMAIVLSMLLTLTRRRAEDWAVLRTGLSMAQQRAETPHAPDRKRRPTEANTGSAPIGISSAG